MKTKEPNFFWAENVRFLRQRKQLSQEALAQILGMSRAKLNAHENGHSVNPPIADLIKISNYFKISIDSLLKIKLSSLGAYNMHQLEQGNDVYLSGSRLRVLAISVDKEDKEQIEYVPIKAKAGYCAAYSDPEYIATLPKYSFPGLAPNATYRMFPTQGDSMLPFPENCDLICRYVQDWTQLKPGTLAVVIVNATQDFVFKKISFLKEQKQWLLESLNTEYKSYTLAAEEVLEVWEVLRYISNRPPQKPTDLEELKTMIQQLSQEIKKPKPL